MDNTKKELAALEAIYNEALAAMGGKCAADLLADNFSWFDAPDLMAWCSLSRFEAGGIMSALQSKGLVQDSGESANNEKRATDWYLTEKGIKLCGGLFDR